MDGSEIIISLGLSTVTLGELRSLTTVNDFVYSFPAISSRTISYVFVPRVMSSNSLLIVSTSFEIN